FLWGGVSIMSVPVSYLTVILIWSTTPLAIKWSAEGFGFSFGVLSRMSVALVVSLMIIKIFKILMPWHKLARRTYMVAGISLYCMMTLSYWGSQYIPSGLISVIFGLTPIVTGILAAVWLKEKSLTPVKLVGLALGFSGLYFIFGVTGELGFTAIYGIIAILLAVVFHSVSIVWLKSLNSDLPSISITTGGLLYALPLYLLTWIIADGSLPTEIPIKILISTLYLGVIGSVLGFVLFIYVVKNVEASQVALITLVTPVFALMLGSMLNNEEITFSTYMGAAIITIGLIIYLYGNMFVKLFTRNSITEV
ncbi:MAG: DMT family transporter, partial [Thiohalomonadales bacterium]